MHAARTLMRLARILVAYRRRAEVVRPLPIRLWVESASCCNLKCTMCPNKDMPAADKGIMPFGLFEKLIDEAADFVSDIYLHHRGEPLLNPRLFDMIALAKSRGIRSRFHTNGMLMQADKAAALLDAAPELVSFSVDGHDAATYGAIRRGGDFETTVGNIERLARMRRERGARRPYIVVEQIKFHSQHLPHDPAAHAALTARFRAAGVDEIIQKEEYAWAEDSAPEPTGPRTCGACTFPWYAMVICHDGIVTPCPQDFWARMVMGNLHRQTLREIWNGEPYRLLRKSYARDDTLWPLCAKCDRLHRKTVGGVPFQYMITFLVDQVVGYGRLRRWLGTAERNA